jgi:NADH dehydrogenase
VCILKGQPTKAFSFKPLGMMASIGHKNGVAEILGFKMSGFLAWFFWRGIYLAKLPTLARKIEIAIDWAWQIFFPPNIVELKMVRTERAGRVHYAAGEFVIRKGDPGDRFFVIESGKAGVYIDENSPPIAILKAVDYFGEGALLSPGRKGVRTASVRAETALDLITIGRNDFIQLSESLGALQKELHRSALARSGYQRFMEMVRQEPWFSIARVSEVMSQPAQTLPIDLTLEETIEWFYRGKLGYPVVDKNGILRGYCGRSELYEALSGIISIRTPVSDFMQKDPPRVNENQSLMDATLVLMREQIEILPVVSSDGSGKVLGVLSPIGVFQKVIKAHN